MLNKSDTKLMLAIAVMASFCAPAYAADTAPGWFKTGVDILGMILHFFP
ncbi:hypothetical protein [Duganella qianjiadongensis]|uniref:Uncharacterized protein n=1 Tax=Duganella qianjiadongensis TaxID=2692176 RepID=A0ABW9VMM6_9BURK|nr:hypothetical protein [Duganella qianjiadongensis]MYM38927.1 hypothetical protein [Duganella qianjiadongensis]